MRIRFADLALLGSMLLLATTPVRAERLEWDQGHVTELAAKLMKEFTDAKAAAAEALRQGTVLQQRTRDAAVAQFEQVRTAAEDLLRKLRSGRGRDATVAYFEQVRLGFREVREIARDAVARERPRKHLTAADEILDQLSRYYQEV